MPGAEVEFVAPRTLEDALEQLSDDGAVLLGGGTSLGLLVRTGLVEPSRLVSLAHVAGLSGIHEHDGTLELGATTTLRELARSAVVAHHAPMLAEAASEVGNPRVRAVATLGGALAHADPRQDLPPVLLAAGATVHVAGARGSRDVALGEFYRGFMDTVLADDEIVTSVSVPSLAAVRSSYVRFTPDSHDDYPTVGVAVRVRLADDDTVADAAIALGGVGPSAFAAGEAASALVGQVVDDATIARAVELALSRCEATSDHRGSAAYKEAMAGVVLARTLRACAAARA